MTVLEKLANEFQQERLKKRPLQPFEDYYDTIRTFEAGFKAAQEMATKIVVENEGLHFGIPNMGDEEVAT